MIVDEMAKLQIKPNPLSDIENRGINNQRTDVNKLKLDKKTSGSDLGNCGDHKTSTSTAPVSFADLSQKSGHNPAADKRLESLKASESGFGSRRESTGGVVDLTSDDSDSDNEGSVKSKVAAGNMPPCHLVPKELTKQVPIVNKDNASERPKHPTQPAQVSLLHQKLTSEQQSTLIAGLKTDREERNALMQQLAKQKVTCV